MAKLKGRARDFQDPDESIVKDHDPEALGHDSGGEGNDSESDEYDNAGTEHYVTVGRSKLREGEGVSLGINYRGSRVSRQALEEEEESDEESGDENDEEDESDDDGEEYDDPETADVEADTAQASDSEIESDDALAESDAEQLKDFVFRGSSKPKASKRRATASDYMSSSDEEGGAEIDSSDEDEAMDDGLGDLGNGGDTADEESEELDEDENAEDDHEDDDDDEAQSEDGNEKQDAKPAPSNSNQFEVDKGIAIQEQRKIYDGLLNIRIRLQKALVAVNTMPTLDENLTSDSEAYEAAEEAAIKLLNTISGLRQNLIPPAAVGEKRKRSFQGSASNAEMWEQIQAEDQASARLRDDRLEKWSRKVQSVNVAAAKLGGSQKKTLISALQEQLLAPQNRLVKRTHVPRSCAPVQAAQKMSECEDIYDDADFYQLLLKELVDQRTVDGSAEQQSGGAVASVMVTANKEVKMRKVVDRKASKGRKMRFTVHEKLQNFMASDDRRSWEQEAIDRLFGTLFGQKLGLNEDEEEDDEMDELYTTEGGPRLFR